MNKGRKTVYSCQACGYETPKWMGKCPECGQWHSLIEEAKIAGDTRRYRSASAPVDIVPVSIEAVDSRDETRIQTGIGELDRVLGGGLVPGTLVLIGGDPGIGKSTLMLQALYGISHDGGKVLYI